MAVLGLRDVPYPFSGMLAICSDIDFCTPPRFKAIHRFCNTEVDCGSVGVGVGLDVGDTCFSLDAPNENLEPGVVAVKTLINSWADEAAWEANTLPSRTVDATRRNAGAAFVARYARAGWIDGLHSGFGAYANPYTFSGQTFQWDGDADGQDWIDFLTANGLTVDTWVLHSQSQSNQTGNEPHGATIGASSFWMDKLQESGCRFMWSGVLTRTGALGGARSVLTPYTIGGYKFWNFPRFCIPVGQNDSYNSQADTMWTQLTAELLDAFTVAGGLQLLYVHMGKWIETVYSQAVTPDPIFPAATQAALRRLRQYQDDGKILVARSSRLLRYNHARDNAVWSYDPYTKTINITSIADTHIGETLPATLDRLRGLTWYVTGEPVERIAINGVVISEDYIIRASADASGYASVGIRWHDWDRTDYTATTQATTTGRIQPSSVSADLSRAATAPRRQFGMIGGLHAG